MQTRQNRTRRQETSTEIAHDGIQQHAPSSAITKYNRLGIIVIYESLPEPTEPNDEFVFISLIATAKKKILHSKDCQHNTGMSVRITVPTGNIHGSAIFSTTSSSSVVALGTLQYQDRQMNSDEVTCGEDHVLLEIDVLTGNAKYYDWQVIDEATGQIAHACPSSKEKTTSIPYTTKFCYWTANDSFLDHVCLPRGVCYRLVVGASSIVRIPIGRDCKSNMVARYSKFLSNFYLKVCFYEARNHHHPSVVQPPAKSVNTVWSRSLKHFFSVSVTTMISTGASTILQMDPSTGLMEYGNLFTIDYALHNVPHITCGIQATLL